MKLSGLCDPLKLAHGTNIVSSNQAGFEFTSLYLAALVPKPSDLHIALKDFLRIAFSLHFCTDQTFGMEAVAKDKLNQLAGQHHWKEYDF